MSRGGTASLPLKAREALADVLAAESDVARVLVRRGADGRPTVLIELTEVAPGLEDYQQRIQELVAKAAEALGNRATKVSFSIGDRAALERLAGRATVVYERGAQ